MRKIFTLIAALVFAVTAFAQATMLSDPADGSTVTELRTITLTSGDPRYPNLVVDKDAAILTRDDGYYEYPQVTVDGSAVIITPKEPLTTPGKYSLSVFGGYWRVVNPSSNESVQGEYVTFNFTIGEAGGGEQPVEVALVADPASGSTVEAPFTSIDVTSNSEEYPKLNYNSTATIEVLKEGNRYCGVTAQASEDSKKLTLTFDQPITEAGEYTISVSQYAIDVYKPNEQGQMVDYKNPGGEFTYTVTAAAETPEAALVSDPADGSTVTELRTVELISGTPRYPNVSVVKPDQITVVKDYMTRFCGVTAEQNGSNVILTLETPATEPGVYEIYLDENTWTVSNGSETITKSAVLAFLIEDTGSGDVDDTVYLKANPEPGEVTELSAIELHPFDSTKYNSLSIDDEEAIYVTKDGERFCGVTSKDSEDWLGSVITLATKATEPGTYVINFPANSWSMVGDTEYLMGKATTLTYTIGGGAEENAYLTSNPAPGEVTELKEIELICNDPDYSWVEIYSASDIKVLKDGQEFSTVTSTDTGNMSVKLTLNNPATEPGTYVLDLPAGSWALGSQMAYLEDKATTLTYTIVGGGETKAYLTSNPAPGEVTELKEIELICNDPDYSWVEIYSASDIKVLKDGQEFSTVTSTDTGNMSVKLTLNNPATEPGTYVLDLPAGSWALGSQMAYLEDKATTLTYTIAGGSGEQPTGEAFIVTPASGSSVEAPFTSIEVRSNSEEWPYVMINLSSLIKVNKGGTEFCGVNYEEAEDNSKIILTFQEEVNEPGEYTVSIPSNAIDVFKSDWTEYKHFADAEFTYTVTAAAPKASLVATPAPGTVKEPLTQILLTSGVEEYPLVDILSKDDVKVYKDDVEFCGIVQGDQSMNGYNIKLTKEVTESGIYKIVFPADSWEVANYDPEYTALAGVDFELVYDVDLGGPRYDIDLMYTRLTPNSTEYGNADIASYEGEIKEFTIDVDGELAAVAGATVNIACKRNNFSQDAKVEAGTPYKDILGKMRTPFKFIMEKGITTNGTYTMTVPQGVLGDAAFVADRTAGHANKAYTWEIICEGGLDAPEPTVVYDLGIKSTKPAQGTIDMSEKAWEVTNFNIDAAYDLAPNSTKEATLVCESAGYNRSGLIEFAMLSFDGQTRTMKFVNGTEPTKNGTYVLTIPQGTFGDAEWREDQNAGHSNPEIKAYFMVTGVEGEVTTAYDVEIASTTPADKAKVNIAETPATLTFTAAGDYSFYPMIDITVACEGAEYNGTAKVTAATVADGVTTFTTALSEPITVNGDYTVTIPQGVIGDAAYIANWTTGHANKEYKMTFTVEGGTAQPEPMKYDLKPTVTPENGAQLAVQQPVVIALVFPEGTVRASEDARASLVCESANYFDTAYFMPTETSGTFQLTFGTKPTREGTYSLTIGEGTFVDAAQAHANPELTYSWEIKDTAIDSIFTDEKVEGGVYDINGVYVGDSLKNLPAGIYIVKGRKVMTTK